MDIPGLTYKIKQVYIQLLIANVLTKEIIITNTNKELIKKLTQPRTEKPLKKI